MFCVNSNIVIPRSMSENVVFLINCGIKFEYGFSRNICFPAEKIKNRRLMP